MAILSFRCPLPSSKQDYNAHAKAYIKKIPLEECAKANELHNLLNDQAAQLTKIQKDQKLMQHSHKNRIKELKLDYEKILAEFDLTNSLTLEPRQRLATCQAEITDLQERL